MQCDLLGIASIVSGPVCLVIQLRVICRALQLDIAKNLNRTKVCKKGAPLANYKRAKNHIIRICFKQNNYDSLTSIGAP